MWSIDSFCISILSSMNEEKKKGKRSRDNVKQFNGTRMMMSGYSVDCFQHRDEHLASEIVFWIEPVEQVAGHDG